MGHAVLIVGCKGQEPPVSCSLACGLWNGKAVNVMACNVLNMDFPRQECLCND